MEIQFLYEKKERNKFGWLFVECSTFNDKNFMHIQMKQVWYVPQVLINIQLKDLYYVSNTACQLLILIYKCI